MKKPRAPRLPFEFAFAYLLPLPAILSGLIWAAILLAISWGVLKLDDFVMLKEVGGESVPTNLVILLFASSLMVGLLPHIVRISSALEEWDLGKKLAPANSRERWREEKTMLAKSLPSGRILAPASMLALIIGAAVCIYVIEIDLDNLRHPTMMWTGLLMLSLFQLLFRGMAYTHFAKVLELARLQRDVHAARDVVLNRTPNANCQSIPPGRLADLLSYVEHVENLPELPFHKATLAISSLYFAVPLGSWLIISGVQNLFNLTFS